MTGEIGFATALGAGFVSFLSPCVLPLLPAYVSFMTGMSVAELRDEDRSVGRIVGPVLLFIAGFTVVFVALGAGASVLGAFVGANRDLLSRLAGVVVALMGLLLLDVIPLPHLSGGVDAAAMRKWGRLAALALGLAFPFALGPCAGPVYGAILTLAMDAANVGTGAALLFVYSIGLAIPFLAFSLLMGRLQGPLRWFSQHAKTVNRVAGAILLVMGVAMATGVFGQVGVWLQTLPLLDRIG